jgi:hypothetical protein
MTERHFEAIEDTLKSIIQYGPTLISLFTSVTERALTVIRSRLRV